MSNSDSDTTTTTTARTPAERIAAMRRVVDEAEAARRTREQREQHQREERESAALGLYGDLRGVEKLPIELYGQTMTVYVRCNTSDSDEPWIDVYTNQEIMLQFIVRTDAKSGSPVMTFKASLFDNAFRMTVEQPTTHEEAVEMTVSLVERLFAG